MRALKQMAIVTALLLCLPMAAFALVASVFVSAVEALVKAAGDD
jgi:hypothetical protein